VIAPKEKVMSARVDKFCDGLRNRLNTIESRVESFKANVQALPTKVEKAVQEQIGEARAKLQAQKERIEKARADLKAWAEHKKAATQATIREWKAKGEAKRLSARADLAEGYAEAAAVVALASIDEAEEAMLEAALARMDADAAQ
jgi:hypothetical protein